MALEKRVKDIMSRIEEYDVVNVDDRLSDALLILRDNHRKIQMREPGAFHKTLFVKDADARVVGKLSVFDLIRGLVPEAARNETPSHLHYRAISSRASHVEREVLSIQERFQWLEHTFFDLVKADAQKSVKEVMSPIHPLLEEEDSINKAIYLMFKENIRQPMVVREGRIVGVVSIMCIFPELLNIAEEESFWK